MAKNILIDAGFLIALCDPKDEFIRREKALLLYEMIVEQNVIIPFPILYETFRTKYSRKKDVLILFEAFVNKNNVSFLDDTDYREVSYRKVLETYNRPTIHYSMVDHIIREIITDVNIRIDYFITFNQSDFQDVCDLRRIEIY